MVKNATIGDVFFAAAGAANAMSGVADRYLEDRARTKMQFMQSQMEVDWNDFQNELKTKGDYENFQKYKDEFFAKKNSEYQKQIKDGYVAKMYDGMMTQYQKAARIAVDNIVFGKQREEEFSEMSATKRNLLLSHPGEDIQGDLHKIDHQLYVKGYYTREQYQAALEEDTFNVYSSMKNSVYESVKSDALKHGWSDKEVERKVSEAMNGMKFGFRTLKSGNASTDNPMWKAYNENGEDADELWDGEENTKIFDLKGADKKINPVIAASYLKEQKAYQESNYEEFYNRYCSPLDRMQKGEAEEQQKAIGRNALSALLRDSKGALSQAQKEKLERILDPDKLSGASGSGGGMTKAKTHIRDLLKTYSEAVVGGEIKTGYNAMDTLMFTDVPEIAKTMGLSPDEEQALMVWTRGEWLDEIKQKYRSVPRINEAITAADNLAKSVAGKDSAKAKELQQKFAGELYDILNGSEVSDQASIDRIVENIQKWSGREAIDIFQSQKIGWLGSGTWCEKYLADGAIKEGTDITDMLSQGFYGIATGGTGRKENYGTKDFYTNERGNIVIDKNCQEAVEKTLDPPVMQFLASMLGTDNITPSWNPNYDGHDVTSERLYFDAENKKDYIVRSVVGKKNENKGLEVVERRSGKTVATQDDFKKYFTKDDKAEKEKRKQEKNAAAEKVRQAEEAAKQRQREKTARENEETVALRQYVKTAKKPAGSTWSDGDWEQWQKEGRLDDLVKELRKTSPKTVENILRRHREDRKEI